MAMHSLHFEPIDAVREREKLQFLKSRNRKITVLGVAKEKFQMSNFKVRARATLCGVVPRQLLLQWKYLFSPLFSFLSVCVCVPFFFRAHLNPVNICLLINISKSGATPNTVAPRHTMLPFDFSL